MRTFNLFIMLVIGVLFFTCSSTEGADWKLLAESEDSKLYYDSESKGFPSMGMVSIWTKTAYIKPHEEKGRTVKHSLNLMEINCMSKMQRLDTAAAYDMDGKKIYSDSDNPGDWADIESESAYEKLHDILCVR